MPDSQPDPSAARPAARGQYVWLLAIAVAGLALRLVLAQLRWINPDEGAHLMDARLVLDGLVPEVDFGARQPVYVYVLAAWLRLIGGGFEGMRGLMALLDTLVGVLVFAIGQRLLPPRSALAAAALYLLLPFTVFWAPLVHTEPLAVVLFSAGMLCLTNRITGAGSAATVVGAGICFGLACYVRQSALAGLLAAVILLALHRRPVRGRAALDYAWLGAGFGLVVLLVFGWYARRLAPAEILVSDLNPLRLPIVSVLRIVGVNLESPGGGSGTAFRSEIQSWAATITNLRGALALTAVLWAGCAAFVIGWFTQRRLTVSVVLVWVGSLGLLYAYWILHRGFYPQYAAEFLPPLALGTGHAVVAGWTATAPRARWRFAAVALVAAAIAYATHGRIPDSRYTSMAYAGVAGALTLVSLTTWSRPVVQPLGGAAAAAAIVWLVLRWLLRAPFHPADGVALAILLVGLVAAVRARPPAGASALAPVARGVIGGLGLATLVFSARVLEPRYSSVWSPDTLRDVAGYLREHTAPDAEVMSGAVIWEFVAGRRPFGTISHPLAFLGGGNPTALLEIDAALEYAPPDVVVLDGYTENTYLVQSPAVQRAVRDNYTEVTAVLGSRFPVRILTRRR